MYSLYFGNIFSLIHVSLKTIDQFALLTFFTQDVYKNKNFLLGLVICENIPKIGKFGRKFVFLIEKLLEIGVVEWFKHESEEILARNVLFW